jgi:hypothetical protein
VPLHDSTQRLPMLSRFQQITFNLSKDFIVVGLEKLSQEPWPQLCAPSVRCCAEKPFG